MKLFKQTFLLLVFLIINLTTYAQQLATVETGLRHLESVRAELKLTTTDIENYRVSDHYLTKHNGVTHIYLIQQHAGIDVQQALININVLPSGAILNMGNRFIADLASKVNTSTPSIEVEDAIQKVATNFDIEIPASLTFREVKNGYLLFENENLLLEPIRCRLVYEKMSSSVVKLAWQVELYRLDGNHWWNARVDAVTGELLNFHDQVIHCSFSKEEVCKDPSHGHHHQKVLPVKKKVSIEKQQNAPAIANSYNVFPMPLESPNHGDREIVVAPANLTASPLGWHDRNPGQGGEFTITRGNNVHAYHDIFNQNQSSGDEPDGGTNLDFDFPIASPEFPYENVDAAVVNLFYWNNVIHDVLYLRGFDEAAGNFQAHNLGNGGNQGDEVNAHALDGGGTNNANFASGLDGDNGRMQMFLWGNNITLPDASESPLIIDAPATVAGEYQMIPANFGAGLPATPIVGELVFVEDGVDVSTDGCEPLINGAALDGKIALVDRGTCQFGTKVLAAQNAGAVAVIVCNNAAGPPPVMAPGDDGDQVQIPAVAISLENCETIRMALPGVMGSILQQGASIPLPGPEGLDSDLDNGVIVHEYGHGISIRTTGGPSQSNCLQNFEQAGEGWSDWFALAFQTTSANNANQRRGIGTYLSNEPTDGDGIRPFPYSRNMDIDPHTYNDINGVSVPHGVGSVWAVMAWDLYWNLVDVHGFDDDIYNGTGGNNIAIQLVYDGLKLQPCSPTFLDSRDAILAADMANYNGENQCLIWETFARRGLGVNALAGGVNDFSIPDQCDFSLRIEKTVSEGEIQSGSNLTYSIEARNTTQDVLQAVKITDIIPEGTSYVPASATCPNTSVTDGVITIDLGDMEVQDMRVCSYDLQVDAEPSSIILLEDKVEEENILWDVVSGNTTNVNWESNNDAFDGDHAWYAQNVGFPTDQILEMKFEVAIESPNAALSFWHKYDTETGFDGGIVEVSTNNGNNWFSVNNLIFQNKPPGPLQEDETSPLDGIGQLKVFHGDSNGYIQSIVNLSSYNDKDIKIRFRFATNQGGGGDGWYIDNIRLYGDLYAITNEACISSELNENKCSQARTIILGDAFVATDDVEDDLKISIAPNPTTGIAYLTMNTNESTTPIVRILSADGKLLSMEELPHSNGTFPIDISEYPSGLYFIQIQSGDDTITEKVMLGKK